MNDTLFPVAPKPRKPELIDITGGDWERQVIDLARMLGWRVAHFRSVKTSKGWMTPVAGDGVGFPDLILVKDRVIAAELKAGKAVVKPEQQAWLDWFTAAGVQAVVWRPEQLQEIADTLASRKPITRTQEAA